MMQPMSRRTLLPALAAAGALIVAAWFYLGTRETTDLDSANAIVNAGDHLSAADARHAQSLLHSAAFLNPDRTIDLDRSRIAVETGNKRRAYRLATSVTDSEPMNAVAWQYVARAASNSGEVDAAFAHFAKLVAPAAR
jgi:predicted Zn-dependent protease